VLIDACFDVDVSFRCFVDRRWCLPCNNTTTKISDDGALNFYMRLQTLFSNKYGDTNIVITILSLQPEDISGTSTSRMTSFQMMDSVTNNGLKTMLNSLNGMY
jgi:hypothetical protein